MSFSSFIQNQNDYSVMTGQMVTELQVLSAMYSNLVVKRQIFKPEQLPAFDRYAIIVSPPPSTIWQEERVATPELMNILKVDLFLLVKNYDETNSLFGVIPPDLGLFQLISDVKELLRLTNLAGMLFKTYDEPAGPGSAGVSFETGATLALDSAEYSFVHRAKLPFTGKIKAYCYPRP